MRAKCAVFPISVRNSAPAVAHLLTKTNVAHLLVGPEGPYQQLAADALKILKEARTAVPDVSTMLAFDDIMSGDDQPFEPLPALKVTWDDPVLVQHSSGECLGALRYGATDNDTIAQERRRFRNPSSGRIGDIFNGQSFHVCNSSYIFSTCSSLTLHFQIMEEGISAECVLAYRPYLCIMGWE